MTTGRVRLSKFNREDYERLIGWVESEEALMQFAGPLFTFPLTPQQLDLSLNDKNRTAFTVIDSETNLPIGHAETYLMESSVKIGRILIGNKADRNKGLGQQIVQMLLTFSFANYNITAVELNVFDWNTAAIKCYEKAGFTINAGKRAERKIKNEMWVALNMTIDKLKYEEMKSA